MSRSSKRINRDDPQPEHILFLLRKGRKIGGDEAKRLLEEMCHAHLRLIKKARAARENANQILDIFP